MSSADRRVAAVFSLYIINKAGGLIYQKNFVEVPKLTSNDYLRLASTFHGLNAICHRGFSPHDATSNGAGGIKSLEAKDFRLQCFQTLTDTKFVMIAAPTSTTSALERLLQQVYQLYVDYVLKNAFYEMEMPIRCHKFDETLERLIVMHHPQKKQH